MNDVDEGDDTEVREWRVTKIEVQGKKSSEVDGL